MSRYTVYYNPDAWQTRDSYQVQEVRQQLPDGRVLVVDLWKGLEAFHPLILRIRLEGDSTVPLPRSRGITTSLSPQDIVILPRERNENSDTS